MAESPPETVDDFPHLPRQEVPDVLHQMKRGASVEGLGDGPGGGHYVQPTLVTNARSDKQVAQILEITKKDTGEPAENIKVMTGK